MTLEFGSKLRRIVGAVIALGIVAACEPADERALSHFENGKQLEEDGDSARALLEYREAVRLNDDLAPAYIAIANIRFRENNIRSAVGHYKKAVEVDETNVEARIQLGRIMLGGGQLDEALKYAISAVQLDPNNVEALVLRAGVAARVENYELARQSAERALELDPKASEAEIVLAAITQKQGDPAAAEARIDAALARNPNHIALNLFKLRLLQGSDRADDTLAVLNRLVEAYPNNGRFRLSVAQWHLQQGDIDAAERAIRAFADSQPENSQAALAVTQFLLSNRGPDEARAQLEQQIATRAGQPDRFEFEMALVRLNAAESKTDDAIALLERMIAAYGDTPNGDKARVRLATFNYGAGDRDKAATLIDSVLAHDARNAEALAFRSQLKLADDRYDAAIQDIRLAIAESPDNWRFLMLEAQAHERNGAQSLVGERLGAAVQASGYEPTPVLAYARHLRQTGKGEFAQGLVENALRRRPNDAALLRALAQLKLDSKDWIGAEDVARRLRGLDNERAGDLANLIVAQSLEGQDQHSESVKLLEAMYQDGRQDGSSIAALVASYLRSGETEKAMSFLDDILKTAPDHVVAISLKGDVFNSINEKEKAEAQYRRVLEIAPNRPAPYAALIRFLLSQNRYDDALTVATAGSEATNATGLRFSRALLLERSNRIPEAIDMYDGLYEDLPQSFVVANNLASLLMDFSPSEANIERAFTVAKRLRSTQIPQYQDTYGWLLYLRGEPEQALRHLQTAAEALPDEALVQYHLGMAYAKAGVVDRAEAALKRALELAAGDAGLDAQRQEAEKTLAALEAQKATAN